MAILRKITKIMMVVTMKLIESTIKIIIIIGCATIHNTNSHKTCRADNGASTDENWRSTSNLTATNMWSKSTIKSGNNCILGGRACSQLRQWTVHLHQRSAPLGVLIALDGIARHCKRWAVPSQKGINTAQVLVPQGLLKKDLFEVTQSTRKNRVKILAGDARA
jgi:hypothetical protein